MAMVEAQRRRQTTSANTERLKRPLSFAWRSIVSLKSQQGTLTTLSAGHRRGHENTARSADQRREECSNKHISKVHITFAMQNKNKETTVFQIKLASESGRKILVFRGIRIWSSKKKKPF